MTTSPLDETRNAWRARGGPGVGSCADGQPTRFYTLSPLADLARGASPTTMPTSRSGSARSLCRPILDRPQLVTRVGGNRMVLADFDSWVEPLPGMFARVLAENLALLLGTDDVLMLPQRRDFALDHQVEVDVTRFDVDADGNAVLDARWWGLADADKLLRSGRSTISEPATAGDHSFGCRRAQPRARRNERGNCHGDHRKNASMTRASVAPQAGLYATALISMRQSNMKSTGTPSAPAGWPGNTRRRSG